MTRRAEYMMRGSKLSISARRRRVSMGASAAGLVFERRQIGVEAHSAGLARLGRYRRLTEADPAAQAGGQPQIQQMFQDILSVLAQAQAGRLKVLATTSPTRLPTLPKVPLMAEAGMPNFHASAYTGMFAPAGTPEATTSITAPTDEPALRTASNCASQRSAVAASVTMHSPRTNIS